MQSFVGNKSDVRFRMVSLDYKNKTLRDLGGNKTGHPWLAVT